MFSSCLLAIRNEDDVVKKKPLREDESESEYDYSDHTFTDFEDGHPIFAEDAKRFKKERYKRYRAYYRFKGLHIPRRYQKKKRMVIVKKQRGQGDGDGEVRMEEPVSPQPQPTPTENTQAETKTKPQRTPTITLDELRDKLDLIKTRRPGRPRYRRPPGPELPSLPVYIPPEPRVLSDSELLSDEPTKRKLLRKIRKKLNKVLPHVEAEAGSDSEEEPSTPAAAVPRKRRVFRKKLKKGNKVVPINLTLESESELEVVVRPAPEITPPPEVEEEDVEREPEAEVEQKPDEDPEQEPEPVTEVSQPKNPCLIEPDLTPEQQLERYKEAERRNDPRRNGNPAYPNGLPPRTEPLYKDPASDPRRKFYEEYPCTGPDPFSEKPWWDKSDTKEERRREREEFGLKHNSLGRSGNNPPYESFWIQTWLENYLGGPIRKYIMPTKST
jgi:hypothetical protein